jgi:hypothetical protein
MGNSNTTIEQKEVMTYQSHMMQLLNQESNIYLRPTSKLKKPARYFDTEQVGVESENLVLPTTLRPRSYLTQPDRYCPT